MHIKTIEHKYKVGDKVRVIKDHHHMYAPGEQTIDNHVGKEFTITQVCPWCRVYKDDFIGCWWGEGTLELV